MTRLPNLDRTAKALKKYDAFDLFKGNILKLSTVQVLLGLAREEELVRDVARAYGFDTADRNDMNTCLGCIRPGPAVPQPGYELSFVRRMVAIHLKRRARQ